MSKVLIHIDEKEAREKLMGLLFCCTTEQQAFFKRIFSPKEPNKVLSEVIDIVPLDKLDSAIQLCERTVSKNNLNL